MKHFNPTAAAAASKALIVPTSIPRALARPSGLFGISIRADAQSPEAMFAELRRTVEAMRADLNGQVTAIVDPLVNARVEAMNTTVGNLEAALTAIQATVNAGLPANQGVIGDIPANPEYVTNFRNHMRTGVGDQMGHPVQAAMSIGSAPDGGYLAPVEWDRSITEQLVIGSPIRANSETITISTQGFSRLFAIGAPGSGWVGETAARPQTSTPTFVPLTFGLGEIYANPAITQTALDDAAINLENWLGNGVRDEFGRQENIAFLSGDGVNKPHGLLTYVKGGANQARHPLGYIDSMDTANLVAGGLTSDDFLNIVYFTPAERIANAKWYMNRLTQASIRKIKDTTGNYIWQPGMSANQPALLHGYPIVDIPGMPTAAAGATIALFGDMRATYLVIDRVGIRVLRDPYTNKPYVMFYTTKRVGGGVQNPEYMKALKVRAV